MTLPTTARRAFGLALMQPKRENGLSEDSLVGFGDGYVEIENIREAGGFAVGVPTNEAERCGIDEWKRERLIRAGANMIIPDYRNVPEIENILFPESRG